MLFIVKKCFSSKLSARRRLFVFTLILLLAFTLVVFVNQQNVINYGEFSRNLSGRLSSTIAAVHLNNKFSFFADGEHTFASSDLQMTSWSLNIHKSSQNDSKSIRQLIDIVNRDQIVNNERLYGKNLHNDSVIIVVQVHKRITYLRQLVLSLSRTKDISKTLIIFSHDFYDEEINELVQSIDFCKVMQIFYPFSIQTHPNEFPGTDPKDCKRDMRRERAITENCQNALYPDLYGHYREASFTQMKHHWWWKLNRVFDQLEVTRHHTGLVLLLEEDYYLSPDFLHVLKLMQDTAHKAPRHNMIALGTYASQIDQRTFDQVEVTPWITSKHNMGMAFNRSMWREIKSCSKFFCDYDDYNYDWSLQNINYSCLKEKLYVIVVQGPRVYHIGECGVHHKTEICDSSQLIKRVQSQIVEAERSKRLFPKKLRVAKIYSDDEVSDTLRANGGWSDLRDVLLCLNMTLTV